MATSDNLKPDSSQIEAAARRMQVANMASTGHVALWDHLGDSEREHWRYLAEAALLPVAQTAPAWGAEAENNVPTKWLANSLRELARVLVGNPETPWIGPRDPEQHICWTAADRLEAAQTITQKGGWRPIETAPKNGTKVDLWFPNTGREIDWEWWDGDDDPWDTRPQWIFRGVNIVKYPGQSPTHWMPTVGAPT